VGGDVPLLEVDGGRILGDFPVLQSTIDTEGAEFSGYFTLEYDDAATPDNDPPVRLSTRIAFHLLEVVVVVWGLGAGWGWTPHI
jgi:hypothetical protein